MRYELRMNAYDMMDQVAIALVIIGTNMDGDNAIEKVLTRASTVRGTGESDPREWAIGALVAALETL